MTQYVLAGPMVRITVGRSGEQDVWRNLETPHPLRLHLAGMTHTAVAHVERDGDPRHPDGPTQRRGGSKV